MIALYILIIYSQKPTMLTLSIPEHKHAAAYIKTTEKNVLCLNAVRSKNPQAWVSYTFAPFVAQNGGEPHCATVIISSLTKSHKDLITELNTMGQIDEIYLPASRNSSLFKEIQLFADQAGIKLIPLDRKCSILLDDTLALAIDYKNGRVHARPVHRHAHRDDPLACYEQ